jgi:hypothetical protein
LAHNKKIKKKVIEFHGEIIEYFSPLTDVFYFPKHFFSLLIFRSAFREIKEKLNLSEIENLKRKRGAPRFLKKPSE